MRCDTNVDCAAKFTEAQRLSKAGATQDALEKFQELYRQYSDARILYPIAVLLQRSGRIAESITYYERFIDSGVEVNSERLAKVKEQLRQARSVASPLNPSLAVAPSSSPSAVSSTAVNALDKPDHSRLPLYKRWWLWTAVSIAVVGVVVGTTLGVVTREPSWDNSPQLRPF